MLTLFVLTTACALGPAVNVEVSVSTPAENEVLRGWLSARLMEEGYDLASSPQAAQSAVVVRAAGDGMTVDVRGAGQRSFAVEAGPASVQRLEVLHRAIQGVDATATGLEHHSPARAVAVRFVGPADEPLFAEIVGAAQEAGVQLTAQPADADTLVCIASRGGLAEIAIGAAADGCVPAETVAVVGTDLERRQFALDLVGRAVPAEGPSVLPDATEPAPGLEPSALVGPAYIADYGEFPPMHGPARAEVRLAAEGGVVVRGAVDPAMRARLRLGQISGLGGRFEVAIVPSRGPNLRVIDTYMLGGADWQMNVGERVRLVLAATAGADIHAFSTELASAAEVSWALALPVGASFQLRGGARVHAMVHPGLSGVTAQHKSRNAGSWERTPWRVGVSLGFSHGWRIE